MAQLWLIIGIALGATGAWLVLRGRIQQERAGREQLGDSFRALAAEALTSLRAPQTRGRWGEIQLRRVCEMAGMLKHCDFDEQPTLRSDDGPLRPDLIVNMPGERKVVVDAKVPLAAYLDAIAARDEDTR